MKLFLGQILIANNPCKMEDDGRSTMTVGKEYKIESLVRTDDIGVIDDEGDMHWFPVNEIEKYFLIPVLEAA